MPSQLLKNDKVSFICARNFSSRGKDYSVGDDFPQEDARDIEVFVRARYVIPVVEELEDKPRHWHRHIRPRDEVVERLGRDRVQLKMPDEPDSDEVVNLEVLTHPETTPEPEGESESEPEPPESLEETYDPAEHNVEAVREYIAEHPEQEEQVLAMEAAGRGRKGLVGE
jgi:hypothetical protein